MKKLLIAAMVMAAASAGVAAAQGGPGGRGAAMLASADTNGDGNITRAEFDTARANHFAQMDANHDSVLSAGERPQMGPLGGAQPASAGGQHRDHGDANGDGSISRAEYDAQGARMFARLDANGDHVISQAEIQAMQAAHQQH